LFFIKNEDSLIKALNENEINSAHTLSPEKVQEVSLKDKKINSASFSRIFALYFNKNKSEILNDLNVRKAIELISPKKEIIENILMGYAKPTNSPIPKNDSELKDPDLGQAKEILEKDGWQIGENGFYKKETKSGFTELKFSISTANVDELVKVTELLA